MTTRSYLAGAMLLSSLFVLGAGMASATTLDAVDRGWYREDGWHQPAVTNYFVGDGQGQAPMRDFFVFDVSGLSQTIVSAELRLLLPTTQNGTSFESAQGIETLTLYDYLGNVGDLIDSTAGVSAYNDLGSGTSYGSVDVTDADEGTFVTITLNAAAIAAINASTGSFVVGGAVTTLDGDPNNIEWIFQMTENLPLSTSQLVVTAVPEPSAALVMLAGLLVVGPRCSRKARD